LGFCAQVPGFSHICPWALLFRPLESSVPYHRVPVVFYLGPPVPVPASCSYTLGFFTSRPQELLHYHNTTLGSAWLLIPK
jgi:hypothetical protein